MTHHGIHVPLEQVNWLSVQLGLADVSIQCCPLLMSVCSGGQAQTGAP